jgi:hypothetical protein
MAKTAMETFQPKTELGQALAEAMDKHNVSVRQLSSELNVVYEHVRRLLIGLSFPR